MTNRQPRSYAEATITVGGTALAFKIDGEVQRLQVNDRPQAYRTRTDEGFLGQNRDPLIIGGITDAFAGRAIGPWSRESIADHLAHGHVHVLHDSEAETRFGYRAPPREKNTLTMPSRGGGGTEKTSSIFGQARHGAGAGGVSVTRQMYNDQPSVFYSGSSVVGQFCWEGISDTEATAGARIYSFAWTGAGFSASQLVFDTGNTSQVAACYSMVVHKATLFAVGTTQRGTAASNQIFSTTDGATWADAGTQPVAETFLEGTRFIDDGNTLWLIMQVVLRGTIRITKSTDGAATWAATTVAGSGQVRSVGKYYNRALTAVLVVLTEDGLYEIDEINNVLELLYRLPARGCGMAEFGGSLYIFMDAMQVLRYTQSEGETLIEDVSPGGGEAMPSGKDFREDTDGAVVLAVSSRGIYAAWSGDGPTSGTLNRALCLFYDGTGWHFIWRAANTTGDVGYSARALALDPVSGDLLYFGATISSSNEVRAHDTVRIIKAETDPRLLTANVFETSGYSETPLISQGPTSVPTTFFDKFYNSENLTAGVTLQTQFGVDGLPATTSTLETSPIEIDLARRYFPSDATAAGTAAGTDAAGSSFNTVRMRTLFVGTAAVGPLLYNEEVGFAKIPDVKDVFIISVIIDGAPYGITVPEPNTLWTQIDTVRDSKTKVTLSYSLAEGTKLVLPISEAQLRQRLPPDEVLPNVRTGTVRLVLAEI